jgi:hypothetical protein
MFQCLFLDTTLSAQFVTSSSPSGITDYLKKLENVVWWRSETLLKKARHALGAAAMKFCVLASSSRGETGEIREAPVLSFVQRGSRWNSVLTHLNGAGGERSQPIY